MTPVKIKGVYYAFWTCTKGYCNLHSEPDRHKASLRTRDKREALARCRELDERLEKERARIALGLPPPNRMGGAKLGDFLADYRAHRQPDKAPLTRDNENRILARLVEYVESAVGREPVLADLDQAMTEGYRRHRLSHLAPRSWNSEIKTLKAIFGWGLTRRPPYFEISPFAGVRTVDKGEPTVEKYVAPDQIEAAAMSGHPFWLNALDFLRVTWCRSSELCNLRWDRVYWGAGYLEFVRPKEKKSKQIPLTSSILQILAKARELSPESTYVFEWKGKPLTRCVLYNHIHGLGAVANVKLSPHMLRHSGVTNALASGAPLVAVQAVVGHSSLQTTQGYVHMALDPKRAAIELLENRPKPATKLLLEPSN